MHAITNRNSRGDRNVIPIRLNGEWAPFTARTVCACSEPGIAGQYDVQSVIPTIKLKSAHGRFEFYGRGDRNRTCDPLHPMQVLYQAELRPDDKWYNKTIQL